MKVQCSCGAKFEFDLTPAMSNAPLTFVCPMCGADSSAFVDALVRRELGQEVSPAGTPIPVAVRQTGVPVPSPTRLHVARPSAVPSNSPQPSAMDATSETPAHAPVCAKHHGEPTVDTCRICGKPLCAKCMELFGYVCSPLCRARAESHGIALPVYEGQRAVVEARLLRKFLWVVGSAGVLLLAVLGVWFWYAWFGSMPKTLFSVRFPDVAYAGHAELCGPKRDQVVFLHGDILARHDIKLKKEIWSVRLLDPKKIEQEAQQQLNALAQHNLKLRDEGIEELPRLPAIERMMAEMQRSAEERLSLHVRGQNIWVASPGKLTLYDWNTGKAAKELPFQEGAGSVISTGDELALLDTSSSNAVATHINLATCEFRTENVPLTQGTNLPGGAGRPARRELAGLPAVPGRDMGKPMDPAKVAEQAQGMSLPRRLALPATLANSLTQERNLAELNSGQHPQRTSESALSPGASSITLIPVGDGFLEVSVRLLEAHIIEHSAMKPSTGKSVLSGNMTAGNSMDAANEMLNEMQRSRGGDVVQEDLSRYQVRLRSPGREGEWADEVIGPPRLFPLRTVNVLTADKLLIVLDKSNRKLWQASLAFPVNADLAGPDGESSPYGQGPCVERNGTLYVFDQGVLSAFDLVTSNAKWRLPTVGIAGLFFDDQDAVYVNSTTASHESLKYARQIDISQNVSTVVYKLDSRTGKILWSGNVGGLLRYVSGKFVYTVQAYRPEDEDDSGSDTGFEKPPFMRIRRLDPANGRELWQVFQQRAPVDIAFDKNTIRLVFRKEVQVLRFLSF